MQLVLGWRLTPGHSNHANGHILGLVSKYHSCLAFFGQSFPANCLLVTGFLTIVTLAVKLALRGRMACLRTTFLATATRIGSTTRFLVARTALLLGRAFLEKFFLAEFFFTEVGWQESLETGEPED